MKATWGIDLGVRSFHAAGLYEDGSLELFCYETTVKGKVADQPPGARHLELTTLYRETEYLIGGQDRAFIEEPPLAGSKNPRTLLKLAQASAAVSIGCVEAFFVEVSAWKKDVIGNGSASKQLVAEWLEHHHPAYAAQCAGRQDFIDATCIALYGRRR